MNEVEEYLRKSGKWQVSVTTDWLSRAIQGEWFPTYYAQWSDAHEGHGLTAPGAKLECGKWAKDDKDRLFWITDTPEWDRQWFKAQGVRPPKRFGDPSRTYWKDYGGGLRGLSYR